MTIHAVNHNMDIANIEVEYRDRPQNSESKLNTFSDGMKVLRTIFSLFKNYRPFRFFTIIAVLLFVLSVAVFIFWVFIPYLHTGLVANFPTLIVCGFVALAALQSFFTGLTLDTEIKKHNQNFEIQRLMICDQYRQKLGMKDDRIE